MFDEHERLMWIQVRRSGSTTGEPYAMDDIVVMTADGEDVLGLSQSQLEARYGEPTKVSLIRTKGIELIWVDYYMLMESGKMVLAGFTYDCHDDSEFVDSVTFRVIDEDLANSLLEDKGVGKTYEWR